MEYFSGEQDSGNFQQPDADDADDCGRQRVASSSEAVFDHDDDSPHRERDRLDLQQGDTQIDQYRILKEETDDVPGEHYGDGSKKRHDPGGQCDGLV